MTSFELRVETLIVSGAWRFHNVQATERISSVKRRIASESCYDVSQLVLMWGCNELEDDRTLMSYGIDECRTLHMLIKEDVTDGPLPKKLRTGGKSIHIDIRHMEKMVEIVVWDSDCIGNLLGQLQPIVGIAAERMALFKHGVELHDDATVADSSLQEGSVLVLQRGP
jgi:predicted RNase H-related nuclease YkuK (DUF458 family)